MSEGYEVPLSDRGDRPRYPKVQVVEWYVYVLTVFSGAKAKFVLYTFFPVQYCRYFQHARFIPIVGVGKRGALEIGPW